MVEGNYEKILERISKASGLKKPELERRIEAKRAKLAGLISREGAAQVIAAELGVSFDNEKLKINELLPGMRKVNVIGKIINLSPVRTFTTKKGDAGKVVSFILADDTSNVKVVLWDTNHIELIEKGEIKEGSIVEISNGGVRDGEVHLGSFSEIKISSESFSDVKTERVVKEKNIADLRNGNSAQVRAFIVQAFEPRFFYICPECKKKVVSGSEGFICETHGKINADKRALMNLVIDDGTETIRAVVFHDALSKLGITKLDDDARIEQREQLIGMEFIFIGNVRTNKFFNNLEFIIDEIKKVNLDELIQEMEK